MTNELKAAIRKAVQTGTSLSENLPLHLAKVLSRESPWKPVKPIEPEPEPFHLPRNYLLEDQRFLTSVRALLWPLGPYISYSAESILKFLRRGETVNFAIPKSRRAFNCPRKESQ